MAKYRCPLCLADVTMTTEGKWRKHGDCENSGKPVAPALIMAGQSDAKDDEPKKGRDYDTCPACGRDPRLDENLAFRPHVIEKGSDEKCPFSGRNKTGKDPLTTARPLLSNKPAKKKEEACISCPEPGCGRTPSLNPDGSIGVHMQVKMGDKVCPSSNQRITTILSPTQVLKSEELPPPATASATGIAADTTPIAQSSTTPVATLPTDALTPESTPRDTVTPNPADAPGTSEHAPELPPASPEQAEHLRIAESILRSEHSCPRTDGTHDVDCVKSFKPRICMHCKKAMEAKHECWIFTPAGEVEEDFRRTIDDINKAIVWEELESVAHSLSEGLPSAGNGDESFTIPICRDPVFVKPDPIPQALDVQPMTGLAAQIAAQMKEIFHAYSNRMERTLQTTLGPSEIGSPCDRRLAMSLMHIPPVSPGMDGWAAFVGTCIHTGLAEMLTWADANTGRFAVEVPLTFPSEYVPKGTSDLLDRVLMVVDDHKAMGRFSLDKLRTKGPSELYRVQLHTYAYGQVIKGEKVKYVAIVAWPREQNSLKDLYVWVEPYQPEIAQKAIARVDAIAGEVRSKTGLMQPLEIAKDFDVADDCKFCPFLAKGDPGMTRGCPGRK